jgi:hypothetical protein
VSRTCGHALKSGLLIYLYENEENQNSGQTKMKKTSHLYAKLKISKGGTDKKGKHMSLCENEKIKMGTDKNEKKHPIPVRK